MSKGGGNGGGRNNKITDSFSAVETAHPPHKLQQSRAKAALGRGLGRRRNIGSRTVAAGR